MYHAEDWIPASRCRAVRRTHMLILVTVLVAVCLGVAGLSHGSERESAVWLGGCSGVCVDPTGLVLTAKHCDFGDQVSVEFRATGLTVTGQKVYTGTFGADDVVAFRLPAGQYPFAPAASKPPARGEVVFTFGFPSGKFEALTGTVMGMNRYTDQTPILETTIPARAGHSGGPLFNLQGEVVGICSASMTAHAPRRIENAGDSTWIATERIHAALQYVQGVPPQNGVPPQIGSSPAKPPRLYVFTAAWCGSCQQFVGDYARNIAGLQDWMQQRGFERTKGGKHYGAVESLQLTWDRPEIARACEVATGQRPKLLPTFWVDGAKDVLVGYAGPEKLKAYLAAQLPQPTPVVPEQPFQRAEEPLTPSPAPVPDPRITDPPGPDANWANVKAIVLVARQERGAAYGAAVRAALELESGAIRRKLQEATKGQADVELVTERLSPARFAAVSEAAGVTVDKLHVVLLVRQQDLGAIRGLAVELVESAVSGLTERSARVPIDFVSERLNPELYAGIQAALNASDEAGEELPAESWWMSAIAAIVGLVKRRFLNREAE